MIRSFLTKRILFYLFTILLPLLPAKLAISQNQSGRYGDLGNGNYQNPILPADFSDPDITSVGADYYAISSTFQYSPGVVILHSTDLVNWKIVGHVVQDLTTISPEMNWNRMNRTGSGIWAGSIRYNKGQFRIYFGTPDEGYFMSSASHPEGPWSPVTPILKEAGWDDPCSFQDIDGQEYLIGTRYSPDPMDGVRYKIHLFKLTADGKSLEPGFDRVIHQSRGSEANKLYRISGMYYHYFSEIRPEGRVAMMGRSHSITGPYEYHQLIHVNPKVDREPNQGGFVQSPDGKWWFLTHQGTGAWEGRALCLLPVTWQDGWPIIGTPGMDGIGSMIWQNRKPIPTTQANPHFFEDDFSRARLNPEWEWHYQPRADKWTFVDPGGLRLSAFQPRVLGNLLKAGNMLTCRTLNTGGGIVTVKLDVTRMASGQVAGLSHYGGEYGWLGVEQSHDQRHITYSANGKETSGPLVSVKYIWLRSILSPDGETTWAYSFDGRIFTAFGERYKFEWKHYRGDRIGIFTYNNDSDTGSIDVNWFRYDYD